MNKIKKASEIDINGIQDIYSRPKRKVDSNLNSNNQFNNNELIVLILLTAVCFLLASLAQ